MHIKRIITIILAILMTPISTPQRVGTTDRERNKIAADGANNQVYGAKGRTAETVRPTPKTPPHERHP